MAFNNSPLLAMAPLTSSNGLHRHQSGEGSGQQDASGGSGNFHQIPFQATPVQHGPNALTFGFGFGSSANSPSSYSQGPSATSLQWGQSSLPLQASPSHRNSPSARGASIVAGKRNETKRRRDSDDDDSDDDMEGGGREKSGSPMSYNRIIASKQALPKRMRSGIGAVGLINLDDARSSRSGAMPSDASSNVHASTSAGTSVDKMDLGKILSTLDKPSLLTLFSRLLTSSTDPSLRDQIIAHIPSPSLDSVEAALDDIEKNIRAACAHSGEMRAEFAWGRLRNPVSDFTATALGFLPFFVDETKDGGILALRQEMPHPSTTYSFLHALTVRTLRIVELLTPTISGLSQSLFSSEGNKPVYGDSRAYPSVKAYQDLVPSDFLNASNPNTIVTQLIPSLLIQWSRLQEKLCKGVNEEGKMFGSEMMRGWILSLEALGWQKAEQDRRAIKVEERAFRTVLDCIRVRLEQEVGWLIGLNPRTSNSSGPPRSVGASLQHHQQRLPHPSSSRASTHMEEEEEL